MPDTSAIAHPLFDPTSQYSRLRASVRAEDKMRGHLHFLWTRLKRGPQPLPEVARLTREESFEWASRLADFQVLSVWKHLVLAAFAVPHQVIALDLRFDGLWCVGLVREADGAHTLGANVHLPGHFLDLDLGFPNRSAWPCRAFLLEPEIVAKLEAILGDRPWTDAFLPEVIAGKFEVAQILAAVPEMEGTMRHGIEIVFDRLRVSERYDTLPPRSTPLRGVIVLAPRPSDADDTSPAS